MPTGPHQAWLAPLGALIVWAWIGATGSAPAAGEVNRPEGSGRLVHRWNFEDRITEVEPIPRNWSRSYHDPDRGRVRPGFPKFNEAELVDSVAFEGLWSLKLPTRGGSTSLLLDRGVVPTVPGGDLMVTVMARTEGLQHARGRVTARFLDRALAVIEQGTFDSEPILTDGSWQLVTVPMEGRSDAVWLQIELELLQPDRFGPGPVSTQEIVREDVRGAVYFDDLRVYQMPRITVGTGTPGSVVIGPNRPDVELNVRDVAGEVLHARLEVEDAFGRIVDSTIREIGTAGGTIRWTPALERFGWYLIRVVLSNDEGVVAERTGALAWLAKPRPIDRIDSSQFGVHVDEPGGRTEDFASLINAIGVGRVWLDVWSRAEAERSISPEDTRRMEKRVDRVVEHLLDAGLEVGFVLEGVPHDLARAAQLDPERVLAFLSRDEAEWLPGLQGLLSRFGERVSSWQVGVADAGASEDPATTIAMARHVRDAFATLIPRPMIVVPWTIERALSAPETGLGLLVQLDTSTPPEGIPLYAEYWRKAGAPMPGAIIETLDPHAYGARAMETDLARRVVLAWSEGLSPIGIERPWTPASSAEGGSLPGVAFGVMRTLVEELSGREAVGELPAGPGVRAIVASPGRSSARSMPGMIVAWCERGAAAGASIDGYLGGGAVVVRDLFGNERSLPAGAVHHIELTEQPVFIEGVDTELMLFRAGLRIEPRFIETRAQRHDVDLIIPNPWPSPIHGELRIRDPESWEIRPRTVVFSAPVGGESRIPIALSFGPNEPTGPRHLIAEIALSAETRYPIQDMPIHVELGLNSAGVWASYRLVDGAAGPASDVEVTLLVTNRGTEPSSFIAVAVAPNAPEKEAIISALEPGEAAVRRFRFEGGGTALRGQRIHVGLIERDGTGRINTALDIR